MPFTKKEWQDTRPSDCKASGVGEACATWAKSCPSDVNKIADDEKATSAAIKAINEMLTALKKAEGKLAKSKDSKVGATKSLITSWRKEAESYQNDLNGAVFAVSAEALKKKAKLVEEAVNQVLKDNTYTVENIIGKLLDEAESAIQKRDVDTSEAKLTSAKRKIFDMDSYVKKKISDSIKVEVERVNLATGIVKIGNFSSSINTLKGALKKVADRADKLDEQWDSLVDGASPTEPDTSKSDPTTKKNIDTVLNLYKTTLKDLTGCQTKAQNLLTTCRKIEGNAAIKTNPGGLIGIISKAIDQVDTIREEAKTVMFDIRESGGKCVKKRQELFKPDNAKPFTPFLTRAITINGKMITALSKASDILSETLETIVSDGNPTAVGPAQTLLNKL